MTPGPDAETTQTALSPDEPSKGTPTGSGSPEAANRLPTLAERKRRLVRDELGEAALRLLAEQGFERTTVDQIVAEVGVSRRTFFRYFPSKEDVVIEFVADLGQVVRTELADRPVEESPAQALREALSIAVVAFREHPEKSVALARLTLGIPALRARYAARQDLLRGELARVLVQRAGTWAGTSAGHARAEVTAGVALVAFDSALSQWADGGGVRDLGELLDEAFVVAAAALA